MKTDVVIPFIHGPMESIELRYALRSMETNLCGGDVTIWLYGDAPGWIQGVRHIAMKREERPIYSKFFDQLLKIELASRNPEIGYRFVYTYDDVYFLKPVTVDYLREPRAIENMAFIDRDKWFSHTDAGCNWVSCMKHTLDHLKSEGLPLYNYETHLPRVYNKEKAIAILEKYRSREQAFQFATMYFNHYECNPELIKDKKFFKLGIYRPVGYRVLLDQVNQSEIMNVANAYEDSIRVLEALFPEPSRWEKRS